MNTRGILMMIACVSATACATNPVLPAQSPTNAREDDAVQSADKSVFARTETDTAKVGSDIAEMYSDASTKIEAYWKTASNAFDSASEEAGHWRMITAEEFAHVSAIAEKCYSKARASVPLSEQSFSSLKEIADGCYSFAHNPKQP
jgi:thioesterase domain-containing protein